MFDFAVRNFALAHRVVHLMQTFYHENYILAQCWSYAEPVSCYTRLVFASQQARDVAPMLV